MSKASIVRGTNNKPVASDSLAQHYAQSTHLDGDLFIGYPIIGAVDGKHPMDAVHVSPTKGIVLFDLVDGTSSSGHETRQDDAATKLQSRLLTYRELVSRRQLAIPIHTLTFGPALAASADNQYPIANFDTLAERLAEITWQEASPERYQQALSAIQSISTIRRSSGARQISDDNSRGARLKRLEESIATLDNLQSKAVIETVEGVQRIRGLAGSGKTIILALKAAYLHAQHPDWRIGVTFNTRSLKAQFTRLINHFFIEQTGEEPNWANVRIINAWGAAGGAAREGIYFEYCLDNGIPYLDFGLAKDRYGRNDAFRGVCADALNQVPAPRETYDAILVDEAQDFPPEFLRLCHRILRHPRRLVYAYDELQNLSGTGLPSAEQIFGTDSAGAPLVSFETSTYDRGARRDIILEKCYRNSRPVLVSAHALGFGIYRTPPPGRHTGLVQMFDQPGLWNEIGYHRQAGALEPGRTVVLERTHETSPLFLENHSPLGDLIQFRTFATVEEQAEWIANEIALNLTRDELRHDDIVVVNPNPLTTRGNLGPVRKSLLDRRIMSHIAGVDTVADVFFQPNSSSITCTGIHRVKGNEAGMVYVVSANESFAAPSGLGSVRNRLFTAITRSKAWVRVVGVGAEMDLLTEEFQRIRSAAYSLRFTYPTEAQRAELQVVHRDKTPEEEKKVVRHAGSLIELLADLDSGAVRPQDLEPALLERLRGVLGDSN